MPLVPRHLLASPFRSPFLGPRSLRAFVSFGSLLSSSAAIPCSPAPLFGRAPQFSVCPTAWGSQLYSLPSFCCLGLLSSSSSAGLRGFRSPRAFVFFLLAIARLSFSFPLSFSGSGPLSFMAPCSCFWACGHVLCRAPLILLQ